MTLEYLTGRPWAVFPGDCTASLALLPADSIDACVTDTPYGLSTILDPPNLDRETLWRRLTEGTAESPIKTLMRAWLNTGDNPQVKGRGFMGKEWDALVPSPNTWRAIWRVLKPGAYCFAFGGTRTYALIEMSLRFADFEIDDGICTWLQGQGMAKRVRLSLKIDEHFESPEDRKARRAQMKRTGKSVPPRETVEGQKFAGYDRALAPKWEPIIVATKPRRGTVAENALAFGTGGLHVDACRLPRGDAGEKVATKGKTTRGVTAVLGGHGDGHGQDVFIDPRGGYPANVAICERVAEELDRMSGPCGGAAPASGPTFVGPNGSVAHGDRRGMGNRSPAFHGKVDGASRFFYVAKASSSERDAGLEDLPPLTAGERCDREDGTAGVNGYAGTRGEGGHNPHPTVKPIALMRWLCRLAAPPGANDPDMSRRPVILDPFAGSGSTGVAAMQEGLRFIGCEMDPRMVEVMRRRLQHAHALEPGDPEAPIRRDDAPGQRTLF